MPFYLIDKHRHLSGKPLEYFKELSISIKNQSAVYIKTMKTSDKAQESSYLVAQIMVKKSSHILF